MSKNKDNSKQVDPQNAAEIYFQDPVIEKRSKKELKTSKKEIESRKNTEEF